MTDQLRLSLDLPTETGSIPRARRAVDQLAEHVDPAVLQNLRLLVSELVTNAIRHVPAEQATTIGLVLERSGDAVRVEVRDEGLGFVPQPRADADDRASGWGLSILARVADRWGVENDEGARVWFEIDVPVGATAS